MTIPTTVELEAAFRGVSAGAGDPTQINGTQLRALLRQFATAASALVTSDETSVLAILAALTAPADFGAGITLPTSDPTIAGAWWDNAGTLTKSSG